MIIFCWTKEEEKGESEGDEKREHLRCKMQNAKSITEKDCKYFAIFDQIYLKKN